MKKFIKELKKDLDSCREKVDNLYRNERIKQFFITMSCIISSVFFVFFIISMFFIEEKIIYDINYSVICVKDFYDCDDFISFDSAQMIFKYCYADIKVGDIHKLDNDGDGWACGGPNLYGRTRLEKQYD